MFKGDRIDTANGQNSSLETIANSNSQNRVIRDAAWCELKGKINLPQLAVVQGKVTALKIGSPSTIA
jgi:hypothetical protein